MFSSKKLLIVFDGLLKPLLISFQFLLRDRSVRIDDGLTVIAIKFMGMGSILKFGNLCDELGVDKGQVILLTRTEHRKACEILGFENIILIEFKNFFKFLSDSLSAIRRIRKAKPRLIVDFERCSNAVSLFKLISAALSKSKSISFTDNPKDKSFRSDILFGKDFLSHEKMFVKGLEFFPKRIHQRETLSVNVDQALVIVNINASDYLLARRYDKNYFSSVVKGINRLIPDVSFCFTGVVSEYAYVDQLVEELIKSGIHAQNVAGKWELVEFTKKLSCCKLFITSDSGPLHLGAMLQTPMVALWGPTQPGQFGYKNSEHIKNISKGMPCSPCFTSPRSKVAHSCNGRIDCMKINPEHVLTACLEFLNRKNEKREIAISQSLLAILKDQDE